MIPPSKKIQIIVTLGPSTLDEGSLRALKSKGVDFVRVNMSHSSIAYLKRAIALAKLVGIPFIIDTEGSQVRTGPLKETVRFAVGDEVRICARPLLGTRTAISLTPAFVVERLAEGDLLYCDFDSLVLSVADTSTLAKGFIVARVVFGGTLGSNKGVYIDAANNRSIELPVLTEKDYESIKIGLAEKIDHIAASFMRSAAAVELVRKASKGKMKIISKVECIDALEHLDEIIRASDALLVDRGDLSKEIFLERIPFTQKIIVHRARKRGKPVIVATNFLESMIANRAPTRAEVHDIESSITDGAAGLTLAAETAIGRHPIECMNVMQGVIGHVSSTIDIDVYADKEKKLVDYLEKQGYLLGFKRHSSLIPAHGGTLVNRFAPELLETLSRASLPSITLTDAQEMDVEQIALGAYSPLEGFMTKKEAASVLSRMRLPSGAIWPLPIVLAVGENEAKKVRVGQRILLREGGGEPLALLHLTEKYPFDKKAYAGKLYGTLDENHPGVRSVMEAGEVLLAGPVTLLRRRASETAEFELTPEQTRRLFESVGWKKVVGFHTRNVIHRGHEYIQLRAIEEAFADGLLAHPVVGKKKSGDFAAEYIAESYKIMARQFYPKNKVVFATLATYSRYAGPKEALFTALVRQNFGCSHFIVGRDHTGVGIFYPPTASHAIFDRFPDLLIKPIRFNQVFYSKKLKRYIHESIERAHPASDKHTISGTEARKLLEQGKLLPQWFMRKEISQMIVSALKKGGKVFVE
jgi:pyruvate kinase